MTELIDDSNLKKKKHFYHKPTGHSLNGIKCVGDRN